MRQRIFTSLLPVAALASAQVGQAQSGAACVAQDDLTDAAIYAIPLVVDTMQSTCVRELSPEGYLATQGETFAAPYRELQNQSWPATARVLTVFAAADKDTGKRSGGIPAIASIFSSQSPDVVRPFVDATIRTLISAEIKPKDCGKIERGMELLAPLPPENAGGLVTFLIDVADVKNPELCPLEQE